ncbi:MAG TPA: hypothetical protein VJ768_08680 [Anaerolineales bacterium]|nr:hypothetical protein [Anaerolineales bacterium]
MSAPELLRALLILTIVAMAALALYFLSRRRLTAYEFAAWGLLALLVPLLGPFLVIYLRPGEKER